MSRLRALAPDLLVVAAYGQIVPASVLSVPRLGPINVHGSLLPRWRGAAPVAYAILRGDATTGVTIMRMDEQLDHGPILSTVETEIGQRENSSELAGRLAAMGARLLVETLGRLPALTPVEQDHSRATYAPKLKREDGELSWDREAVEIDRRVRAFHPWPGVTVPFGAGRVKILRGRPERGEGAPGEVLRSGVDGVEVACAPGSFVLEDVQVPGSRPQPAASLSR